MTTTLNNFTSETQLTTGEVAMVSTTSSEVKYIGKATFTNTSASAVEVTVWRILIATTGTTGSGGNWLDIKTIQPGKVWVCDKIMSHVLGNVMQISALADTGSVINVNISGTTET